ncbi:MAG TPA: hypothetical protein ENH82_11160 [bacterium]|nr:hypothetical protein [bacterium]
MKIKANTKNGTIDFIPEKDIDCFHLGMVFGKKSHSSTIVPPNKLKVVTAKVEDIWLELLREAIK